MFHNSQAVLALSKEENPTVFQKTLGLNDFYFGSDDFEYPAGQHPDGRQVVRRRCTAARSRSRPSSRPRARSRAWPATRSTSGSRPRTCRGPRTGSRSTATATSGSATRRPTRSPRSGSTTSSSRCSAHLGMHHDHLVPRHAYLKNEIPVAGVAHQAGTCRFGTDPDDLGAQRRLPGARARQPLRRRHQLLPEHRRGEPGADRDGQRAARRRPPARAAGRAARRRRSPPVPAERHGGAGAGS